MANHIDSKISNDGKQTDLSYEIAYQKLTYYCEFVSLFYLYFVKMAQMVRKVLVNN